jgi:hypothetical protein
MRMVAYRSPGLARRWMASSAAGLSIISAGDCDVRVLAASPFDDDDHGLGSLSRSCGNVDPALMVLADDLCSDEPTEG